MQASMANLIADYFYEADQRVRADLSKDKVVSERDYLSRYISLLEYPFGLRGSGSLPFRHLYFANNFSWPLEQKHGCDTLIEFINGREAKLLAIEGKYPQFHTQKATWDYTSPKTSSSHFSDQIARQVALASSGVAVLEMFINHDIPGNSTPISSHHLDGQGSSFVTHSVARSHTIRHLTWKNRDALAIIGAQHSTTGDVSIRYFVNEVLNCNMGKAFEIGENVENIDIPLSEEQTLRVPIYRPSVDIGNNELSERISDFMKRTGIRNLGFVEYQSENVQEERREH
jgi:hypothetical protein